MVLQRKRSQGRTGHMIILLIIGPVRPCERFLCKTIDDSPVWGPYAFARAGPEKAVRPHYISVRPRVFKLQENLSPNWSYDKILIDYVRSGRMEKYLALGHRARTSLRSVPTSWPRAKYFPIRPSRLVNKYILCAQRFKVVLLRVTVLLQPSTMVYNGSPISRIIWERS